MQGIQWPETSESTFLAFQIIGGLFYTLNKIFFALTEHYTEKRGKKIWHVAAWGAYLIGLPPWIVIFIHERNWIAASIETGGVFAMILGLIVAFAGVERAPKWLDFVAFATIPFGLGYSLWDFGGITSITQVLELGLTAGFLCGTYLLAKEKPSGYLWYLLMSISALLLLWQQNYAVLASLQIISFSCISYAYWCRKYKKGEKTDE